MRQSKLIFLLVAIASSWAICVQSSSGQSAFDRSTSSKMQKAFTENLLARVDPTAAMPPSITISPADNGAHIYQWKQSIVTTVFWIGESSTSHNPVPNESSSWDSSWARSYGGFDDPSPSNRQDYMPVKFTPKQNPFYCALPYNDKARTGHRSEAPHVVPWFKEAYQGPAVSVCKDRWVAIRKGNRVVYAQWEDAGPFRTDHWEYVFGNDRPKPNLNHGAGLDVSPAVRDYLGLAATDVTDWKFVDFKDVPNGPWARHGDNNTFVINARKGDQQLVKGRAPSSYIFR